VIRDEGASVGEVYGELREQKRRPVSFSYARAVSNGAVALPHRPDGCGGSALRLTSGLGRLSKIASTVAIHNESCDGAPTCWNCFYRPYPRSRLGEEKTAAR